LSLAGFVASLVLLLAGARWFCRSLTLAGFVARLWLAGFVARQWLAGFVASLALAGFVARCRSLVLFAGFVARWRSLVLALACGSLVLLLAGARGFSRILEKNLTLNPLPLTLNF